MTYHHTQVDRKDRIAVVRFDSKKVLNPLSFNILRELTAIANAFEDDLETAAVVITGARNVFTAGLDLGDPEIHGVINAPIGVKRHAAALGTRMCRAWERMPQVTIAAIEGMCIGGGVSLAVACDFRVLTKSSYFLVPELDLGFNMSWQTIPRLVNLLGPSRTKQIILLAEKIFADQALDWGLSDYCTDDGLAEAKALSLAAKIASKPPIPVRMTKRAVNAHANALNEVASFMDADQFTLTQLTQDHTEGLTAFLEKRAGKFKGA